jgi:hypothetical protein
MELGQQKPGTWVRPQGAKQARTEWAKKIRPHGQALDHENRKTPISKPAANAQRPNVQAETTRTRIRRSCGTSWNRSVIAAAPPSQQLLGPSFMDGYRRHHAVTPIAKTRFGEKAQASAGSMTAPSLQRGWTREGSNAVPPLSAKARRK